MKLDCICRMPPGHPYPNQETYMLDHRCKLHGEKAQPGVWGRHKDLELVVKVAIWDSLAQGSPKETSRLEEPK